MKKFLLFTFFMFFVLSMAACDPTTTEASLNTNITQRTTSTYVAVTHIELILDKQEVCVGDQINLTVNVTPTNATNQNFTITLSQTTYVDFANPNNPLILEVIDDLNSNTVETIVTATSDDNITIDDTQGIYVHPSLSPGCQP